MAGADQIFVNKSKLPERFHREHEFSDVFLATPSIDSNFQCDLLLLYYLVITPESALNAGLKRCKN